MKSLFINTLAALILLAAFFTACKKENAKIDGNQNVNTVEAMAIHEKVQTFFNQREAYKANSRSDNGAMTVEESREILDVCINYTCSDIYRHLDETTLDTLRIPAPKPDESGNFNVNDIIEIYDYVVSYIQDDAENVNYFMIVFSEEESEITIVYTRGMPDTPVLGGPFTTDDNWTWGYDNGKCDGSVLTSDAAKQLTSRFQYVPVDIPGQTLLYIVNSAYRYIDAPDFNNTCNCTGYGLFYMEGEDYDPLYCITNTMLNCYYQNIYQNTVLATGAYHTYTFNSNSYSYTSPYRECKIFPKTETVGEVGEEQYIGYHKAEIHYFDLHYIFY